MMFAGLFHAIAGVAFFSTREDKAKTETVVVGDAPATSEYGVVNVGGSSLQEFDDTKPDTAVGTPAPTLTGTSPAETAVSVIPGQPTLVMFVAHWCPHCQREVPAVTKWITGRGGLGDTRLVVVATATDVAAPNFPPSKWLADSKLPAEIIRDDKAGTAASAFGLKAFPYFVALDASGKVEARVSGELSTRDLETLLAAATGSAKPAVVIP